MFGTWFDVEVQRRRKGDEPLTTLDTVIFRVQAKDAADAKQKARKLADKRFDDWQFLSIEKSK